MSKKLIKQYLTFDDIMLVPQYSDIESRKHPDVSVDTKIGKLSIPIVSSPMNTVTETDMMVAFHEEGGLSVLHRYLTKEAQVDMIQTAQSTTQSSMSNSTFYSVGATGDYLDRAKYIRDQTGLNNVCVDLANGHSIVCIRAVQELSKEGFCIMAGNVCTGDGFLRLVDAGAHMIRVGIGNGSMCSTRIVTGHGLPSVTALEDCKETKDNCGAKSVMIIADGGIRNSGDIVKAIAVGADLVMVGSVIAGTNETPGKFSHSNDLGAFKIYAGMASTKGRSLGGWFSESESSFVPEGESVIVERKGPVKNILGNLVGGLKVGMTYSGAKTLNELQKKSQYATITNAGYIESTPHGRKR